MENNFIIISVILPICLHLDDRIFKILYKKGTFIEIRTINIFSNKYSTIGTAQNMEVESDTFSQFRFTELQMKIPHFELMKINLHEIQKEYEKIFLKYYNRFIDAYRITSGRIKIRNSWSYNDFLKPLKIATSKDINPDELQVASFSFGDEPLVTIKPLRSHEDHNTIEKYLNEEPELYKQFFNDARRDFLYSNYIHCNINAVIALEIAVSDYITNYATSKGVDNESIENFIKDVGLTGNIKITLKMITPNDITIPSDEMFSKCKSAITTRNKIVHKGLREISVTDLENNLNAIEGLINFCKST